MLCITRKKQYLGLFPSKDEYSFNIIPSNFIIKYLWSKHINLLEREIRIRDLGRPGVVGTFIIPTTLEMDSITVPDQPETEVSG